MVLVSIGLFLHARFGARCEVFTFLVLHPPGFLPLFVKLVLPRFANPGGFNEACARGRD